MLSARHLSAGRLVGALLALTCSSSALAADVDTLAQLRPLLLGEGQAADWSREQLVEELQGLGGDALDTYVGVALGSEVLEGAFRFPVHEVLIEVLGGFSPSQVFAAAEVCLQDPDASLGHQLALVPLVSALAGERELGLLFSTLGELGPEGLMHPRITRPVEGALVNVLERDARAASFLTHELGQLIESGSPLVESCARALRAQASRQALPVLTSLLEHERYVAFALAELARVGVRGQATTHAELCALMRLQLFSSVPGVRLAATIGLGRLRDDLALVELAQLVDDRDGRVASKAEWALSEITGARGRDAAGWRALAEEQEVWLNQELPQLAADLQSDEFSVVLAALREASRHMVCRHEVSDRIRHVLQCSDVNLVKTACATLADLGSPRGIPALIDLLSHPDASVADAAHRTLQRLTGEPIARSWHLWTRWFEGE